MRATQIKRCILAKIIIMITTIHISSRILSLDSIPIGASDIKVMRSFYLIRIIDFLLPEVVLEIPLFLVESKQIYQYFSHQSIVYSFSRFAFFKFEDFTLIGSIVEKSRHKLTHSFIILGKFGKIVLLWIGW